MILKTSLHIHTSEDKNDGRMIGYDAYRLIDHAVEKGFNVLGFTPHKKYVFKEEFADYARSKGVLLIPGIELSLGRVLAKHVIILNCGRSAEKVKNFKQLIAYKAAHPDIFILSPHPTYNRLFSIGARNLKKYINLFDAVEHSWLYSLRLNSNRRARAIAAAHRKPFIATGDVHVLNMLDTDYALLDAEAMTIESVFAAIRQGRFENVTFPKSVFRALASQLYVYLKNELKYWRDRLAGPEQRQLVPVRSENETD